MSSEMATFGPLVVDWPTEMNATLMIRSTPKKKSKLRTDQKVCVIKNSLTDQEMNEAGKRWINHKGPYMTLAETLAYAAERANQADELIEPRSAK